MNFSKMFAKLVIKRKPNEELFDEIIGCEDIKRLFRMALDSPAEPVHILLSGPPASAKTLFLQALMILTDSYFVDGSNTTKSGMIDYIFNNKPKLLEEIDKMASKDQSFLLNLMETGMVSETKHKKTRTIRNVKTWVFATSNNVSKVMLPLQSRFFVVNLKPYTYEQFYQITVGLLTKRHKVREEIAEATANAIWDKSANIRDCVKIGRMAKSLEDVMFIVGNFLTHNQAV